MGITTEKLQTMLDSNIYLKTQVEDLIDLVDDVAEENNERYEKVDRNLNYIYSRLGALKYQVDEMEEEYDTKIKYLTLGIILLSALTGVTLALAVFY